MWRCVRIEKLCPGEMIPDVAVNASDGDPPVAPYGLPPPPPPPAAPRRATDVPPRRRVTCCSVMSVTHTWAMPAAIAAAPSPSDPAAPPPPDVNDPAKRT